MKPHNHEAAFTLIELLTVVAIIGILSVTSISGFSSYRASAAYAVAVSTFRSSRNSLEVALSSPDQLPAALGLTTQTGPGPVNSTIKPVLPGMQLSRNAKLTITYDPTCKTDACTESQIVVKHCQGKEYVSWTRSGDGVEILLQHVAGIGC